jgi:hypothetical protein
MHPQIINSPRWYYLTIYTVGGIVVGLSLEVALWL